MSIDRIITENINRFIIKEWGGGEVDVHDWLNIGKINYSPYLNGDYIDIWSNPNNPQEYVLMMHKNNGVGRSIGTLGNIPSYAHSQMTIFDEYSDTDYSIPFLGERRTNEDQEKHKIFMSKLNIVNGKVLLQHNSSIVIKDGKLSAGHEQQEYSKNSDFGWYSWATEKIGNDPSNVGQYTYYALVDINDIYDYQNDIERISNLRKAVSEKKYVAMYWGKDTDVIAVTSYCPTPIYYILNKQNGEKFDANWKKIS